MTLANYSDFKNALLNPEVPAGETSQIFFSMFENPNRDKTPLEDFSSLLEGVKSKNFSPDVQYCLGVFLGQELGEFFKDDVSFVNSLMFGFSTLLMGFLEAADDVLDASKVTLELVKYPQLMTFAQGYALAGRLSDQEVLSLYLSLPDGSDKYEFGQGVLSSESMSFEIIEEVSRLHLEQLRLVEKNNKNVSKDDPYAVLKRIGYLGSLPSVTGNVASLPLQTVVSLSRSALPSEDDYIDEVLEGNKREAMELVAAARSQVGEEFWSAFENTWEGTISELVSMFEETF